MPLPMDAAVAVGDVEGYIHYLNIDDGAIDSRVRVGESPIMPIMTLIDDTTLVAQSRDGVVFAVQLTN
jgi:outer membrane protein assembly factor BamB